MMQNRQTKASILNPNQTVGAVIEKYPDTIHVWIALKTQCVGCYLARFCTLAYVAESYHMEMQPLMDELEKVMH